MTLFGGNSKKFKKNSKISHFFEFSRLLAQHKVLKLVLTRSLLIVCLLFENSRGGVNRSATILLAYLMKTEKLTLKQAWDLVHGQRPMVQPVQDYMQQLHQYELELYGVATMAPQEVGESNSLTNRIAQWRDSKKVKGSTPADLASNRSSEGSPLEGDSATRSATAPSVGGSSSPIVNLTGALSGASSTTGTSSADTAETCPDSDLKLTPSESSVGAK